MASSSSSSSSRPMKYQVFLSFRGEDTRLNFTTYLLKALKDEGLDVFFDEEKLEKGETLSQALSQAIAASNISLVVLSKDYASSKSCLAELCDIMGRNQTQNHIVLPIFYHVDPSDVKNLWGCFKSSFEEHESKGLGQVQQWKAAFAQVGHLKKWWHIENTFNRLEFEYINDIVTYVKQKLMKCRAKKKQKLIKHQIFLSFKAEDTGLNFTGHLRKALEVTGISVLSDHETLSHKYQAIAASNLSIIVLSVDYASSESCLAAVSDIMSCKDTKEQIVLPIFYHVDPSQVRNIGGTFNTSFEKHESKRPVDDEVKRWKVAFTRVGQLKGWHIEGGKFDRYETEYIKDIVEYCIKKLDSKSKSISEGLIGIEDQKETILRLIENEKNRVIGLWGMGGSGKTTLAEVVYNEISPNFESHWFVQNVREKIEKQGMESLRNDLLSKLLNLVTCVDTPSIGSTFTQQRLENKRVIVVLDDVNDSDQIVDMGIKHFGTGSKIIVTSRDKQELENGGADKIHTVGMLNEKDSLQLFSTFAFKQLNTAIEFRDLSNKFVRYALGSPLALKVLGSRLYKKSRQIWESEVVKLKEYAKPKISQVLERSFYVLDELEKNIFLDIAIFYKGEPRKKVEAILSYCYNEGAVSGINSLLDKCLLEIINIDGEEPYESVSMHDMLEEMGKDIVRQESKHPFKRSRLWAPKDVLQVLQDNKGTDLIEGIKYRDPIRLTHPCVFEKMPNLKYIYFNDFPTNLSAVEAYNIPFPDELRVLRWFFCPFKSFSLSFNTKNLGFLNLSGGNMDQLWSEDVDLVNLREIDVSNCKNLRKIPSLTGAINLRILDCKCCFSLIELPCLDHLASLEVLYLSNCNKLRKIPSLTGAINLQILDCEWCKSLVELPCLDHLASLEKLYLSSCNKLRKIPSLTGAINLRILDCQRCESLVELPCLNHLASLEKLKLDRCKNLEKFPELPNHFSRLILPKTRIQEVSDSIEHLVRLETLNLKSSKIKKVSSNISKLESLHHLDLSGCPITEFPEIPRSLKQLHLSRTPIRKLQCKITFSILDALDCTLLENVSFTDQKLYQFDPLDDDYGVMDQKLSQFNPLDDVDALDYDYGIKYQKLRRYGYDTRYAFFMLFGNCFRLNQDSVDNIEANAMFKIECLAEKWVRKKANGLRKKLICCFPSNLYSAKMFEHHSVNPWISLKISPNECGGSRFLAFSIYLVVDLANIDYRYYCTCEYKLTTSGGHEKFKSESYFQQDFELGPWQCADNHVLILFSTDMIKKDKNYEEALVQFYLGKDMEVKNCGVHVSYVDEEPSSNTQEA